MRSQKAQRGTQKAQKKTRQTKMLMVHDNQGFHKSFYVFFEPFVAKEIFR